MLVSHDTNVVLIGGNQRNHLMIRDCCVNEMPKLRRLCLIKFVYENT